LKKGYKYHKMKDLDEIKIKLRNLYAKKEISDDHLPIRVLQKDKQAIFLFRDQNQSNKLIAAISKNGIDFNIVDKQYSLPVNPRNFRQSCIVENYTYKSQKVMYYGDRSVNLAYLSQKGDWKVKKQSLIINSHPLMVGGAFERPEGILVLYYDKLIKQGIAYYSVYLALFSKERPDYLLWRTKKPIWEHKKTWLNQSIDPLGVILLDNKLINYWWVNQKIIYGLVLSGFQYNPDLLYQSRLQKHAVNPVISPIQENDWEAFNTFNPAALYAGEKVHILYRAQGFDYVSSVGYAVSKNGIDIDQRLDHPIYSPTGNFEVNKQGGVNPEFISAGGFGGCEDPRITKLGNRVYMTYVAFDGWSPPRLALTSILLKNFLNQRWLWSKPVLISPPGIIDKSGCLFPEKIQGKYVFLHRVFPNILIDFVDDLNFDGKTKWLKGEYEIKIRPDKWDSRKIGAGAPPIKTKEGWLLIYYGVNDLNDSQYQVGAMLLDLKNPTKVLYRTNEPILKPTTEYENNGFKPGIVYPCGAVVIKGELFVYYGGADSVVCVASADLDTFLKEIKTDQPICLHPLEIRELSYG